MQILIQLAVAALFLLSPNLLYGMGIGYNSGNPIFTIHPASYLLIAAAIWAGLVRFSQPETRYVVPPSFIFMLVVTAILVPFVFVLGDRGFKASIIIVTYLSPAILLYLLRNARGVTLRNIRVFLLAFLIVNSLLGFYEYTSQERILPSVLGAKIEDWRPTALLGHPLVNALVTGGYLLSLLIALVRKGFEPWRVAGIVFFTASMLSFGGRSSLVTAFAMFALFAVVETLTLVRRGGLTKSVVRVAAVGTLFAVAIPFILVTPLAVTMLERFGNSEGSDATRVAAFQMLSVLTPQQLFTGISETYRTDLQLQAGSDLGVEISWISLIMSFGVVGAIALISGMLAMLWAGRNGNRDMTFLIIFFVIVTFSALMIGSRTLVISNFMVLMFCGPLSNFKRLAKAGFAPPAGRRHKGPAGVAPTTRGATTTG